MSQVIITGATGFIGRRLIKQARRELDSSEILCLVQARCDSLEKSGRKVISRCGLEMKRVDLVSGKGLGKFLKSPGLIFHLAATAESSATDHRCNDIGTKNLVESLGSLGPKTHFVFTSTTAVMAGRSNCSLPINELTPAAPSNEYGRTKLAAEEWLKKQCQKSKFRLTIVRLGTVFGSQTRPNGLFDALKKLIVRKSFLARLNWPGLTGLVHVDDVVEVLLELAKNPPLPGKPELYILSPYSLSLAQISEEMHRALGVDYREIRLPSWFWKVGIWGRKVVPCLESVLPAKIYNFFWRGSLIVDNVLHAQSKKIFRKLPQWEQRRFRERVTDVVS